MRRATTTPLRACIALLAFAAPLAAQTPGSGDTQARAVGGFVMQGIALTSSQQRQVRVINQRYYEARVALTRSAPGHGASDPVVQAKLRQNLEEMLREERAVLSPHQHTRFDENVAQARATWRNAPVPAATAASAMPYAARAETNRLAVGGNALDGVTLTPDQARRIGEIARRHHAARASLTRSHPTHGVGDPVLRAQLYADVDRMLAEQRSVLTAAQRTSFDRNLDGMSAHRARVEARVATR